MTFKNSIKILFSNFNLVWKMLLFFVVVFAVMAFALYLIVEPIIQMIDAAGFFARFVDLYTDFLSSLNLTGLFDSIAQLVDEIFVFIGENISTLWYSFLGAFVMGLGINCILCNLVNYACCNSLHLYMGSMTKQGFFTSLAEDYSKNLRIQIAYYFVTLPINLIGIVLLILSLQLFNISWAISLIAVFVIIIGFILFMSFKAVLFSAWIPTIVVMNYGIFKSLKVALKMTFKKFGRVFSTAIGIVLTLICVNMFFGLFSFMTGLLISIPISYLLCCVFGMVIVYEGQGMRYYVDIYNVITPHKKEVSDKLKDMLYIV